MCIVSRDELCFIDCLTRVDIVYCDYVTILILHLCKFNDSSRYFCGLPIMWAVILRACARIRSGFQVNV